MLMNARLIVGITILILIISPHIVLGMVEEGNCCYPQSTLKELAKSNNVGEGLLREVLEHAKDIKGRFKIGEPGSTGEEVNEFLAHSRDDYSSRDIHIGQLLFALYLIGVIFILARNKMSLAWKVLLVIGVILELLLTSART